MSNPSTTRQVAVVLHDVAPARWDGCVRVLALLRALAEQAEVALPVTLLVVPALDGTLPTAPFVRWLRKLSGEGHELALHGFLHRCDVARPAAGDIAEQPHRGDDAEFAWLTRIEAEHRIAAGRAWALACGLSVPGFVAPGWAMSRGTRHAVDAAGFDYTCTPTRVVALPGHQSLATPSLRFDNRSAWHRGLTVLRNHALASLEHRTPLLRLELHPDDADHDSVRRCWTGLLAEALAERRPVCLSEAATMARALRPPRVRTRVRMMIRHRLWRIP